MIKYASSDCPIRLDTSYVAEVLIVVLQSLRACSALEPTVIEIFYLASAQR